MDTCVNAGRLLIRMWSRSLSLNSVLMICATFLFLLYCKNGWMRDVTYTQCFLTSGHTWVMFTLRIPHITSIFFQTAFRHLRV